MKIVLNNNNKGNTFCKVINLINFLKVDSRWINVDRSTFNGLLRHGREDEPRHSREDESRHGRESASRHGRGGEPRLGREDERENFLNSRQNRTRRLVGPRRLGAFNATIPFLEILPRVSLGLVVCAANKCRSS
jgi:hypothetical protein